MKIRRDYVTNSSSSSFIIARDKITRGHLLDVLLEMTNKECDMYDDDDDCDYYSWDDVTGNGVGHFRISEYVGDDTYTIYSLACQKDNTCSDVFVVNNEDCGRYDWSTVEKVLDKYSLPLVMGNCD